MIWYDMIWEDELESELKWVGRNKIDNTKFLKNNKINDDKLTATNITSY